MSESVPFYELTYESTFKGMQKVSEIKEELDLAEDESKRIDILECFKSTFLLKIEYDNVLFINYKYILLKEIILFKWVEQERSNS